MHFCLGWTYSFNPFRPSAIPSRNSSQTMSGTYVIYYKPKTDGTLHANACLDGGVQSAKNSITLTPTLTIDSYYGKHVIRVILPFQYSL